MNLLTGFAAELVGPLAAHLDVDALDLAGLDLALYRETELAAAENVKRVVPPVKLSARDWLSDTQGQDPYWIAAFLEVKTVWHPVGVFQSSEIYGGIRSSYDYGPLGVELKNNIKKAWWRSIVQLRDDVVRPGRGHHMAPGSGRRRAISSRSPTRWSKCTDCHQRFREDHLIEAFEAEHGRALIRTS